MILTDPNDIARSSRYSRDDAERAIWRLSAVAAPSDVERLMQIAFQLADGNAPYGTLTGSANALARALITPTVPHVARDSHRARGPEHVFTITDELGPDAARWTPDMAEDTVARIDAVLDRVEGAPTE
ncbi:MAG: hypothetical protein PSX37_08665 [bacterium]|nr:hypothetical protein [bacterium]